MFVEGCDRFMADYKSMYFKLFNSITEVLDILIAAQSEAEEEYLNMEETHTIQLKKSDDSE